MTDQNHSPSEVPTPSPEVFMTGEPPRPIEIGFDPSLLGRRPSPDQVPPLRIDVLEKQVAEHEHELGELDTRVADLARHVFGDGNPEDELDDRITRLGLTLAQVDQEHDERLTGVESTSKHVDLKLTTVEQNFDRLRHEAATSVDGLGKEIGNLDARLRELANAGGMPESVAILSKRLDEFERAVEACVSEKRVEELDREFREITDDWEKVKADTNVEEIWTRLREAEDEIVSIADRVAGVAGPVGERLNLVELSLGAVTSEEGRALFPRLAKLEQWLADLTRDGAEGLRRVEQSARAAGDGLGRELGKIAAKFDTVTTRLQAVEKALADLTTGAEIGSRQQDFDTAKAIDELRVGVADLKDRFEDQVGDVNAFEQLRDLKKRVRDLEISTESIAGEIARPDGSSRIDRLRADVDLLAERLSKVPDFEAAIPTIFSVGVPVVQPGFVEELNTKLANLCDELNTRFTFLKEEIHQTDRAVYNQDDGIEALARRLAAVEVWMRTQSPTPVAELAVADPVPVQVHVSAELGLPAPVADLISGAVNRLAEVELDVRQITSRQAALEQRIGRGTTFAELSARIDGVDSKLNELDGRVTDHVEDVDGRIDQVETEVQELGDRADVIDDRVGYGTSVEEDDDDAMPYRNRIVRRGGKWAIVVDGYENHGFETPAAAADALCSWKWNAAMPNPWRMSVVLERIGSQLSAVVGTLHGNRLALRKCQIATLKDTVGVIQQAMQSEGPGVVVLDVAPFASVLLDHLDTKGRVVIPFDGSLPASDRAAYGNVLDESYFGLREALAARTVLLPRKSDLHAAGIHPEELAADLTARRYTIDERGRRRVESRNSYRKRGGSRSLALAQALALLFYPLPDGERGVDDGFRAGVVTLNEWRAKHGLGPTDAATPTVQELTQRFASEVAPPAESTQVEEPLPMGAEFMAWAKAAGFVIPDEVRADLDGSNRATPPAKPEKLRPSRGETMFMLPIPIVLGDAVKTFLHDHGEDVEAWVGRRSVLKGGEWREEAFLRLRPQTKPQDPKPQDLADGASDNDETARKVAQQVANVLGDGSRLLGILKDLNEMKPMFGPAPDGEHRCRKCGDPAPVAGYTCGKCAGPGIQCVISADWDTDGPWWENTNPSLGELGFTLRIPRELAQAIREFRARHGLPEYAPLIAGTGHLINVANPSPILGLTVHPVIADVLEERERQDEIHGGEEHDNEHSAEEWIGLLSEYVRRALLALRRGGTDCDELRRRFVQIAALAVAAVEARDRACGRGTPTTQAEGCPATGTPKGLTFEELGEVVANTAPAASFTRDEWEMIQGYMQYALDGLEDDPDHREGWAVYRRVECLSKGEDVPEEISEDSVDLARLTARLGGTQDCDEAVERLEDLVERVRASGDLPEWLRQEIVRVRRAAGRIDEEGEPLPEVPGPDPRLGPWQPLRAGVLLSDGWNCVRPSVAEPWRFTHCPRREVFATEDECRAECERRNGKNLLLELWQEKRQNPTEPVSLSFTLDWYRRVADFLGLPARQVEGVPMSRLDVRPVDVRPGLRLATAHLQDLAKRHAERSPHILKRLSQVTAAAAREVEDLLTCEVDDGVPIATLALVHLREVFDTLRQAEEKVDELGERLVYELPDEFCSADYEPASTRIMRALEVVGMFLGLDSEGNPLDPLDWANLSPEPAPAPAEQDAGESQHAEPVPASDGNPAAEDDLPF